MGMGALRESAKSGKMVKSSKDGGKRKKNRRFTDTSELQIQGIFKEIDSDGEDQDLQIRRHRTTNRANGLNSAKNNLRKRSKAEGSTTKKMKKDLLKSENENLRRAMNQI